MDRAAFVKRLAVGAFAVPVVTAFAMDGLAQASPGSSAANGTTGYPPPGGTWGNGGGGGYPPPPPDRGLSILEKIFRFILSGGRGDPL
jgi:hypothetical protein